MSILSLLLRLLMCVSLVANGAGFAQASTRMQLAHTQHAVEAVVVAPVVEAEARCHDDPAVAAGLAVVETADPPSSHHDAAGGHASQDSSDCCEGSVCSCMCAQPAPIAFASVAVQAPLLAHASIAMGGATQHGSPRLPHLIRPPIRQDI